MQSYEIFPKKLARSRNMSYLCIAIETETVLKTKNSLDNANSERSFRKDG